MQVCVSFFISLATLLDPRFKQDGFREYNNATNATVLLKAELKAVIDKHRNEDLSKNFESIESVNQQMRLTKEKQKVM